MVVISFKSTVHASASHLINLTNCSHLHLSPKVHLNRSLLTNPASDLIKWIIVSTRSFNCNLMQMSARREKQTSEWHAHSRCVDLCFVVDWYCLKIRTARRKKQTARLGSDDQQVPYFPSQTTSVHEKSKNIKCNREESFNSFVQTLFTLLPFA